MAIYQFPDSDIPLIPGDAFGDEKTFSSADVIRIASENLSEEEMAEVLLFFNVALPISGVVSDTFEIVLSALFPPSRLFFAILRMLKLVNNIVERLIPFDEKIISFLFGSNMRPIVLRAINNWQDKFSVFKVEGS